MKEVDIFLAKLKIFCVTFYQQYVTTSIMEIKASDMASFHLLSLKDEDTSTKVSDDICKRTFV